MSGEIDDECLQWFLFVQPTPTWDDIATWHENSSFHCVPQSLESITAWIALEGGKNGCSASHLQNIIKRHTHVSRVHNDDESINQSTNQENNRRSNQMSNTRQSETPHIDLDLTIMEYWWSHLREHPALTFTHAVSPPVNLSDDMNDQSGSVQLHEDGVLIYPFDRADIPFSELSLSYSACVAHYSTLRVTASQSIRRQVLGWHVPHAMPFNATYVGTHSKANKADPPDESVAVLKAGYCLLETVGKSAWTGMYQAYLHVLLGSGHSLSSLYPAINHLRFQNLVNLTNECGRPKVWLSTWRQRCVSSQVWCDNVARQLAEWRSDRPRVEMADTRFDDFGEDVHCDENLWKVHYTPEFLMDMPWVYQIYRVIHNAGTAGTTSIEIRNKLGGFGMKTIDSFLSSVAELFKVKAVADRQGKLFVYRYYSEENFKKSQSGGSDDVPASGSSAGDAAFQPLKEPKLEVHPAFFHERKSLALQHLGTPGTPRSPATSSTEITTDVAEIPSTPVSTSYAEPDSAASSFADTSSSRLGGQRSTTLLQNKRVQYVLDALEKAENQIVACSALNRQLAEVYPPLMTRQTISKFYTVMQTDGLIDVRSFIFSSRSGKKMQPILVARRRALNEHLDAQSDAKVHELMKQVGMTEQRFKYRTGEFKISKIKAEAVDHELDETTEATASTPGTIVAESAVSEASDDGSDIEIERRDKQRQRERSAYQRCMFGWIAPPVPRARWLQGQLFSEYMNGPNPVVRRDVDGSLTFLHEELNSHIIWSDFLLLVGVDEKIFHSHPEVMDPLIVDKRLNELPESFREVVQLRSKKQIPLLGTLHLMRELGLIEPYVHADLEWGAYVDKYRLIEIKNVEQDTFDFKKVEGRDAFWSRLYQITTRHLKSEQILAFAEPFGFSAYMCKYLSNNRQWLIRASISDAEKLQLDAFDSSSSHPGRPLSIQQILRASILLGRSVVVLYVYYCRKYYPHLYDVHVRTQAVGERYVSLRFKGTGVKPAKNVPFATRLMKVRRRRTVIPVTAKRRKTGPDTSARVESEEGNLDEDDDSSDEDSQDNHSQENDSAAEGQVRAERYHYSEEMTLAIIAALREWLEHYQIDVEEYEGLEIPENVKDHPWLPKIAPLLAAAQFAEISQRTQLVQESQAVRKAMIAKKKQQAGEIDLESRKNFVLEGQQLPPPPPVVEIPVRTREVPDLSMKTRLNFILSRIPPGPSYYQLSCYLDRIRKRLQIRTIRSAYGKSLEYKNVSELLDREPHLVGLFNLLLTAVLQPDHLYDVNVAHQTVSGYSDDDVGQMIRAMQDDYVVSRKRLNVRGQQRSYQASGRFQESIRVVGSVADIHDNVRQMYQMIEDMEMAPFGTSWPVLPETPVSSAWAIMEELTRSHVDLDIEEVRPLPLKHSVRKVIARSHVKPDGQSNNQSNDSDDEYEPSGNADMSVMQEREAQQAGAMMEDDEHSSNQFYLWALPAMEARSNVFTSSWMSLIDINTLSEAPTRPYINQSVDQSNEASNNHGLPHHEFGVHFGVSTSFGDSVLDLADEFDQNEEAEQSINQSINQSITEPEIDPVSRLYESNGQQVDALLQSADVIALTETMRDVLLKSGKNGLNIDQLLQSINQSNNQSNHRMSTSSITRLSVVPIPSLNTESSTSDLALSRLLFSNLAFVAPGYNQFLFIHQNFAQQWQVPDSRSVNEILDEERSWYQEIKQSNNQSINQSITTPLYVPSALQAWPWRHLHGDINEELHSRMLDSVVAAVSDAIQIKQTINQSNNQSNNQSIKQLNTQSNDQTIDYTSITEDLIALQMKSCTRMQIRALLATLILDGRVHESAHFDAQGNLEMRYQPSDTIGCYWLTEKQTN